jgi:dihydroorotate dehydrogenase
MDPEIAHEWTLHALKAMQKTPLVLPVAKRVTTVSDPRLSVNLLGLSFPNPVGLAAGFDKHATVYPALAALGFGFIEVGTLTPRPQPGNPKPRLFRLLQDQAVINRMGFNNHGVESARSSFIRLPRPSVPVGINLGKNKDTPNQRAVDDYLYGLEILYPHGDYFVVNVSSPNTQGLRQLQEAEALHNLLGTLLAKRNELSSRHGFRPLLLKIAPDLTDEALETLVATVVTLGVDGLIATNTTLSRDGLTSPRRSETGGLSGRPLTRRSTEVIRRLYALTNGRIPIIGVGGIFTGADAYEKIRAGACLIQVYTGMIYRGPSIARHINEELMTLLERDGFRFVSEAVGADHA